MLWLLPTLPVHLGDTPNAGTLAISRVWRGEEPAQPTDLQTEVWLAVTSVMQRREATKVKTALAGTRHLSTTGSIAVKTHRNKGPQVRMSLLPAYRWKSRFQRFRKNPPQYFIFFFLLPLNFLFIF